MITVRKMGRWMGFWLSLLLVCSCFADLMPIRSQSAAAAFDPNLHLEEGRLSFRGPAHAHDLLVTPLSHDGNLHKIVAEADITPVSNPGSSWAPSLFLYWGHTKWASIGIASNSKFYLQPTAAFGGYTGTAPLGQTYRVRIEWEQGTIRLWGGVKGAELSLLKTGASPEATPPTHLIIGKGFDDKTTYTNPFLANSFSTVGSAGNVSMDNIAVYYNDQLEMNETFDDGIDLSRWTILMSPASEPKQPATLEELFPNWINPGARGDREGSKVLYKEADWDAYHARYAADSEFRAFADSQIEAMKNDVALTMSYGMTEINNMIPATTPLADLFTPCPSEATAGFPHGAWTWNPADPERIYCGGVAFPNEYYPEEGEMVAHWGGVEQKFTYYNRESYEYLGFQLSPSFTSYIRAKKVKYMSFQLHRIAILYKLTGDLNYAVQAKKILLRFAEVYPHWLLHSGFGEIADTDPKYAASTISRLNKNELTPPGNTPDRTLHSGYWMAGRARGDGLEGSFLLPVASSYDMIANAKASGEWMLTDEDRLRIERDILLEGATLLIADPATNNKSISNQTAAAAIGAAVSEPVLVRFGLNGFNKLLSDWYKADGSPSESPTYGLQAIGYLWQLGEILNGYSDPEGYMPEAGQQRLDHFSVYNRSDYRMVFRTLGDSLLPSMNYPALGDSYTTSKPTGTMLAIGAKRTGIPSLFSSMEHGGFELKGAENLVYQMENISQVDPIRLPSLLFPQWKLAFMRGGENGLGSAAILNASEWGGHRHLDSLDFSYWANDGEALSDLGYLWDSPNKAMTSRSAAHNLVVVNQKDQTTTNRGGSIGLYEDAESVIIAEASSRAYAETDVYARTLMQLQRTDWKPEYVVDFFRVRGGSSHDYMLHASTTDFIVDDIELQPAGAEAVGAYQLEEVSSGVPSQAWTTDWKNAGGTGRTKTWHIPSQNEKVYIGDGWGQRGNNDVGAQLPYLVRNRSNTPEGNIFASVFESYQGASGIRSVEPLIVRSESESVPVFAGGFQQPVGLQISGDGWRDIVIGSTGLSQQSWELTDSVSDKPVTFSGRYGVVSYRMGDGSGEAAQMVLAGAGRLEHDGDGISIPESEEKQGFVSEVFANGFSATEPVPGGEHWKGSHVLVKKGSDWTAYPVLDVGIEGGKTRFFTYNGNEGFPFAGGEEWKLIPYAAVKRADNGEWMITSSAGLATTFSKDRTPPLVSFSVNGNTSWETSVSTEVTVIDQGSGVDPSSLEYVWSDSAQPPVDGWLAFMNGDLVSLSGMEGEMYLHVRAGDLEGNQAIVTSNPFKLDSVAPVTTDDAVSGWQASTQTVAFTASDAGSGAADTFFSVNGGAETRGAAVELNEDGVHEIHYYSVDAAGNREQVKSAQARIDRTGPAVESPAAASDTVTISVYRSDTVNIPFTVTDSLSGVASAAATLDGEAVALPVLADPLTFAVGDHSLVVTAADHAGNITVRTFTLHMVMDEEHLDDMLRYAADQGWIPHHGILNSLMSKVEHIRNKLERGQDKRQLYQAFINEVKAQTGKKIDADFAGKLLADIEYLIGRLSE